MARPPRARCHRRNKASRRTALAAEPASPMPSRKTLKIATFNVNGIRTRLPHLLQWLAREQPDVACLQELKAADEGFPIDEIHDAGYGALWVGQRSWNGVAVLVRDADPVEVRRALPRSDERRV